MSSSIFCIRLNDFLQFISLKKSFSQIYFILKQFYFKYNCQIILFIIVFHIMINLKHYGRRHFKLFINCHVSWDTLYIIILWLLKLGITMLIHNKDDIEFESLNSHVYMGHPVQPWSKVWMLLNIAFKKCIH